MKTTTGILMAVAATVLVGAATAAVSPLPFAMPFHESRGTEEQDERICIKIKTDVGATTIRLNDDLKPGETRELRTDEGKLVTLRRDADQLVLKVGDHETRVPLPAERGKKVCRFKNLAADEGGGKNEKTLVVKVIGGGRPLEPVDADRAIDGLESLRGADVWTKQKVKDALAELMKKQPGLFCCAEEDVCVISPDGARNAQRPSRFCFQDLTVEASTDN